VEKSQTGAAGFYSTHAPPPLMSTHLTTARSYRSAAPSTLRSPTSAAGGTGLETGATRRLDHSRRSRGLYRLSSGSIDSATR